MKLSGIYKIQSKIKPERIYIGSSANIHKRWGQHLLALRHNRHSNAKLQHHFNKYGKVDLVFSILIGCDEQDLICTEQFYIDVHNPFFNICKVAGCTRGRIISDETKRKIGDAKKGNKYSVGRVSWIKGKSHSDATKQKMREISIKLGLRPPSQRGIKQSDETIAKRVKSMEAGREERIRKLRISHTNPSPEVRQHMSEAAKKAWGIRKLKLVNVN